MPDFEEPARQSILSAEKAEEYAADLSKVASAVQALLGSEGWSIFITLFESRRDDVKNKDDYPSLEDFRADRRGLKFVDGIIEELAGYIDDASRAQDLFSKITRAEGQTPRSTVSLSTGEHEG